MLKPIDIQEVPPRSTGRGLAKRDIMEFLKSDANACVVEGWEGSYKDEKTACVAYTNEARKANSNIRVMRRGDTIYLVKVGEVNG